MATIPTTTVRPSEKERRFVQGCADLRWSRVKPRGSHSMSRFLDVPVAPARIEMGDLKPVSISDASEALEYAARTIDLVWPDFWLDGLVGEVWPMMPAEPVEEGATGSTCGHAVPPRHDYTAIYFAVFDPLGVAESVVHEAAHVKLYALGTEMETHNGCLIQNEDSERYESPVRKDKPRPMSAVLHAQYSYTYITHLHLAMVETGAVGASPERLMGSAGKIAEGVDTIRSYARPNGKWVEALLRWDEALIKRAENAV